MLRKLAVVTVVAGLLLAGANAQERVSVCEKGSLLVFPKVELRWDAAGNLIQDTFISLTNDYTEDVAVLIYFVSEACTQRNNDIYLSHNEPTWWSSATGLPKGVSPFTVLGDPISDPEGSGELILRGFIVLWAIDMDHQQIRWNHLTGEATIVNYAGACAWEYSPYAFAAHNVNHGEVVGTAGEILIGDPDPAVPQYDWAFNTLLLDFFAADSMAFSGGGVVVAHDTDLTLLILDMDLRQETEGPYTTKADFMIWNEDEVSFSGMEYCITKWDESLLSSIGGHFDIDNLHTDKGKARIDGVASIVCDVDVDPTDGPCGAHPDDVCSMDVALLGVAVKVLDFSGLVTGTALAGTTLVGAGYECTSILYDTLAGPEEGGLVGPPAKTPPLRPGVLRLGGGG